MNNYSEMLVTLLAGPLDGGSETTLPGLNTVKGLVLGLIPYALVACAAAFLIGAGLWAVGSWSQNPHHSTNGKKTLAVSLAAALLIGAGAYLVGWFNDRGKEVASVHTIDQVGTRSYDFVAF